MSSVHLPCITIEIFYQLYRVFSHNCERKTVQCTILMELTRTRLDISQFTKTKKCKASIIYAELFGDMLFIRIFTYGAKQVESKSLDARQKIA